MKHNNDNNNDDGDDDNSDISISFDDEDKADNYNHEYVPIYLYIYMYIFDRISFSCIYFYTILLDGIINSAMLEMIKIRNVTVQYCDPTQAKIYEEI